MKKSDIKILVDDEPDIINFRYNLSQEGYEVYSAKDGKSAIKKAEKIPNLIIMDVMMPHMDGIEAWYYQKIQYLMIL